VALIVKWTARAKTDYTLILEYLHANWTKKELQTFTGKTAKVLFQIAKNPKIFPASKKKDVRKCVLIKQISIYYRIKKNEIELLSFWDNRRTPKKLKL
jgi:plasmid stabilization system protein ParE